MGISIGSLLIILLIVVMLFGTKKLRTLGDDLGAAIKNFRGAVKDEEDKTVKKDSSGQIIEGEVKDKSNV